MAIGGVRAQRSGVVLTEVEASKPIGIRSDNKAFVTLSELSHDPEIGGKLGSLSNLGYEDKARFTIARLEREPKDSQVGVIGGRTWTRDELIEQIREGSEIGRSFIAIDQAWIERVKEKVSKGEYRVRGQISASVR